MKGCFFILVWIGFSFVCAQEVYHTKSKNPTIILNEQKGEVVVLDQPSTYRKYSIMDNAWLEGKYVNLSGVSFEDLGFKFIALNAKILIDTGGGRVLEFHNDTLRRIDSSFEHRNQYNGLYFLKNDNPCIFGGVGLFSIKNCMICFNKESRRWEQLHPKENRSPQEGYNFAAGVDANNVYVYGFYNKNQIAPIHLDRVWKFDLEANEWTEMGKVNKRIHSIVMRRHSKLSVGISNYHFPVNAIFELDFAKNTCYEYRFKDTYAILKGYDLKNKIVLVYRNMNSEFPNIKVMQKTELMSDLYDQFSIIEDDSEGDVSEDNGNVHYLWIGLPILLVLLFFLLYIRKKEDKIVLFSGQDLAIIQKMLITNDYMQYSDFNDLFNYNNADFDTIKKRREKAFQELEKKVRLIFQESTDVFDKQKYEKDKRITRVKFTDAARLVCEDYLKKTKKT